MKSSVLLMASLCLLGIGGVAQASAVGTCQAAVVKPDTAGVIVPNATELYEADTQTRHTFSITGGTANQRIAFAYDYALYIDGTAYESFSSTTLEGGTTVVLLNQQGEWMPAPFLLAHKKSVTNASHVFKATSSITVNAIVENDSKTRTLVIGPVSTPGPGPTGP